MLPFVARRTVDLAPAVLLAMQLLMGALFGILGVLFADPILATLKVVLVDLSQQQAAEGRREPRRSVGDRRYGCARLLPCCCCCLLLLLRLHLLQHRRAAARDLPNPHLERKRAVLGKPGGGRSVARRRASAAL